MEVHSKMSAFLYHDIQKHLRSFFSSLLHLDGQNDRYIFRLGQVSAWEEKKLEVLVRSIAELGQLAN
jgi:hypothetical protein